MVSFALAAELVTDESAIGKETCRLLRRARDIIDSGCQTIFTLVGGDSLNCRILGHCHDLLISPGHRRGGMLVQEIFAPAHLLPVERAHEMQVYVALDNEFLHPGRLHLLIVYPEIPDGVRRARWGSYDPIGPSAVDELTGFSAV